MPPRFQMSVWLAPELVVGRVEGGGVGLGQVGGEASEGMTVRYSSGASTAIEEVEGCRSG